jgi:hypothetical protein
VALINTFQISQNRRKIRRYSVPKFYFVNFKNLLCKDFFYFYLSFFGVKVALIPLFQLSNCIGKSTIASFPDSKIAFLVDFLYLSCSAGIILLTRLILFLKATCKEAGETAKQ